MDLNSSMSALSICHKSICYLINALLSYVISNTSMMAIKTPELGPTLRQVMQGSEILYGSNLIKKINFH